MSQCTNDFSVHRAIINVTYGNYGKKYAKEDYGSMLFFTKEEANDEAYVLLNILQLPQCQR